MRFLAMTPQPFLLLCFFSATFLHLPPPWTPLGFYALSAAFFFFSSQVSPNGDLSTCVMITFFSVLCPHESLAVGQDCSGFSEKKPFFFYLREPCASPFPGVGLALPPNLTPFFPPTFGTGFFIPAPRPPRALLLPPSFQWQGPFLFPNFHRLFDLLFDFHSSPNFRFVRFFSALTFSLPFSLVTFLDRHLPNPFWRFLFVDILGLSFPAASPPHPFFQPTFSPRHPS